MPVLRYVLFCLFKKDTDIIHNSQTKQAVALIQHQSSRCDLQKPNGSSQQELHHSL